jgi:hypothetical protein
MPAPVFVSKQRIKDCQECLFVHLVGPPDIVWTLLKEDGSHSSSGPVSLTVSWSSWLLKKIFITDGALKSNENIGHDYSSKASLSLFLFFRVLSLLLPQ